MAWLRLPFDMHFTQKTYYFQKIVTSPFLGQKLQMTHQNVCKKKDFYPIILTCLLCLLFLEKNGVWCFVLLSNRVGWHILLPLFEALPRGLLFLIGTWGRCLCCGVTHWDPIMLVLFCFDWHLWCVHGNKSIFHGTSPIPFSFIKLSPPDPNMSTYLDR